MLIVNDGNTFLSGGLGGTVDPRIAVAGVMGYALTKQSSRKPVGEQGVAPTQTLLKLLAWPFQRLGISKLEQQDKPTTQGGKPVEAYVMSYGTANGKESLLVKGRILSWSESWVEVESQNKENYSLLLPEKKLLLRCLP